MKISIVWDGEDRIQADFNEPWTWEDFYSAIQQMHTMIAGVSHPVDIIIVHHVDFPSGNPLRHFQSAMKDQPPNTGQVFIVPKDGQSAFQSFLQALVKVVERVYPTKSRIRMVSSLEEARRLSERART